MTPVLHDLRHAWRLLRKTPGFTLVAILTLGFGIGACTAIYTVVHGVLLRPLPYPQADRVMQVSQVFPSGRPGAFSDPNYVDLREQNRTFQALAAYNRVTESVTGGAAPVRAATSAVSREFFDAIGVRPRLGRSFLPEEQRVGAAPAVIVSHAFWRDQLASDPAFARRTLTFGTQTYTIVGVMPPGFRFPGETHLWTPRELSAPVPSRTAHNWRAIGRLRDGVSVDQARADMHAIAARLKQQYGELTWMTDAAVVPLHEELVGRVRRLLQVILGAVGFLLLVACANVVNLLLTRATARQRELAVRAALGASRLRLLTPFLGESFILTTAGGLLGVAIAAAGVRALLALEPGGLPRLDEVTIRWPVLAFTFGVSAITAAVLGLLGAARAMKADVYARLKEGGRSQGGGSASARVRSALVVAQLAVSLVLLIGAALLGRSFFELLHQDTGFRTEHLVTMEISSPRPTDESARVALVRLHDDLEQQMRAQPGVTHVGGTNAFPLTGGAPNGLFLIVDGPGDVPETVEEMSRRFLDKARTGAANYRVVSPGYFKTMGIPLVRGRLFDDRDVAEAPHVAVISESLAKIRWPDRDPIGLQIAYSNMDGDPHPFTIVGIVADTRDGGLGTLPPPAFYGNARQRHRAISTYTLVAHTTGDPAALIGRVTRIVHQLAPDVPPRFRTMEQIVATSVADRRFSLLLLSIFAAAALLLAMIGIYGVMSYVVTQRTQEMGIRLALGATRGDIVRLVLGQGARLVAIGLVLGLIGALLLTRLLQTMLFEVTATDPLTYAVVAMVLAVTAIAACQMPAWRATRVDPLTALRAD